MKFILGLLLTVCCMGVSSAHAADFQTWLTQFRAEAAHEGISQATLSAALDGVQPLPKVIALDKKQPEHKITFAQYKKNVVNAQRIQKGRALVREHAAELSRVEKTYGVAPQYIVALWGIETNFGSNTGGFKVVDSLATLAWEGRRAAFFRGELLNALKIIDEGHISADAMKGSWAGAMGQNQFMPSSFMRLAVDGNGDGKRDIWNTKADVFASSANYLARNGWAAGQRWGRRVHLTRAVPESVIGPKVKKPLSYWSSIGVRNIGGGALPVDDVMASLVAPDGAQGQTYLVYGNYQTIMSWNRSTYFATSVGLLADAIAAR